MTRYNRGMAKSRVSPSRRRIGNLLALLVVSVLAVTVWQGWDYWREMAGFPARRSRHGRNFYAMPVPPGRGPYAGGYEQHDEMDWDLRDRVRTALEIQDERQWGELEPKVSAVVRIQRQLPETTQPLGVPASGRLPAESDGPDPDLPARSTEELAKLRVQLKQARDDLRKSVSRRQEAALVLLGILD